MVAHNLQRPRLLLQPSTRAVDWRPTFRWRNSSLIWPWNREGLLQEAFTRLTTEAGHTTMFASCRFLQRVVLFRNDRVWPSVAPSQSFLRCYPLTEWIWETFWELVKFQSCYSIAVHRITGRVANSEEFRFMIPKSIPRLLNDLSFESDENQILVTSARVTSVETGSTNGSMKVRSHSNWLSLRRSANE